MSNLAKLGYFIVALGLYILIMSLFELKDAFDFDRRAIDVEGTIVRQEDTTCTLRKPSGKRYVDTKYPCYDRFVEYQVAGTNYSGKISPSISPSTIGEKIRLKVDARDPNQVSAESKFSWTEFWLGIFPGCFFICIGAVVVVYEQRKKKLLDYFQTSAQRVRGRVTHIAPTALTALVRNPRWVVKAEWTHPQTGQTFEATSFQDLWKDPRATGQVDDDGTVDVRFDPNDPKRCAILMREVPVPHGMIRQG